MQRIANDEGTAMDYKDLSDELKEKVIACKTPEELLALAKEEGYELTDEELQSLSGGVESPFVWDCDDYVNTCMRKDSSC